MAGTVRHRRGVDSDESSGTVMRITAEMPCPLWEGDHTGAAIDLHAIALAAEIHCRPCFMRGCEIIRTARPRGERATDIGGPRRYWRPHRYGWYSSLRRWRMAVAPFSRTAP